MNHKPDPPRLTIRAIRCVGVEVPMTYALGTSRGTITKAPLLLIDLDTEEGVTGRSYLWCYFPVAIPAIAHILREVEHVVKGEREPAARDPHRQRPEEYSRIQFLWPRPNDAGQGSR
jgi:mandelate racemase